MKNIISCKVVVVGAGPAGLMAAIGAGNVFRKDVYLLEKNTVAGRKFLLSGSGQCNVTHGGPVADFFEHYGGRKKARFVTPALLNFDNRTTVRYFEDLGVPMQEREDGKIFPKSQRSRTLLDALFDGIWHWGRVTFQNDTTVKSVRKIGTGFQVETNQGVFSTEKLVLATGGSSYPKTGSTGDGFRLAESLGHRIVPPRPALTPVYAKDYRFDECSGIAFREVKIELHRNGKRIQTGQGDALLTHHGLSGPGILDLSRWIEPGDEIRICLHAGNLRDFLVGKKMLKRTLASPLGLPERFLVVLLESLEISPEKPATEVNRDERKRLESALTGLPFVVDRLGGWNEAMATAGGVALDEVNRQTMESRLVPGLFFCGETLDVDGDTGGYNIQFALSSGVLAGRSRIDRVPR